MNKIIQKTLTMMVMFSTVLPFVSSPAQAVTFSDVPTTDTFYSYIKDLADNGVVSGYSDGTFRPEENVTRGQIAKFIRRNHYGMPIDISCGKFPDVNEDNIFFADITTLKCAGIINGYSDGTFRPEENVTRGAAIKFIIEGNSLGSFQENLSSYPNPNFNDLPTTNTFYMYITAAYHRSIVSGFSDNTFRPNNPVTRGEVSKMIFMASYDDMPPVY